MGTIFIPSFKYGMDRRRPRASGVPGALWVGKNVHLTRGGDIERPKRFVPVLTLPTSQTMGLGAVRGQLYTFGSVVTPAGLPSGIQYQRLQAPDGSAMTEVLDVKAAAGKLYVIARFASGHIYHFYNGARVTDWDALAAADSDFTTLANYMAELISADSSVTATASGAKITLTAKVAGTAFTITASTTNGGAVGDQTATVETPTANVSAVPETRGTGTVTITGGTASAGVNKISSLTVNSVALISTPVNWVSSNSATANALATKINNGTATHGYSAAAAGAVVTLTAAPGTGVTVNGHAVAVVTGGNVTAATTNISGGVAAVSAVAQVSTVLLEGTFEPLDSVTVAVNGRAYVATGRAAGMGVSAFVYKKRMWSPGNSLWHYSRLNVFSDWSNVDPASGAGFINVSNETEGTERLVGAATYGRQAAIMSRGNTQVWDLSTDATANAISQPVDNTGTVAARSLIGYGNLDVFYLSETGVKSLRARDTTGQAYAEDIGTTIAPFLRDHMDALTGTQIQRAVAAIEPREGRLWIALGERIYVLSYFPGSDVRGWTYYEPGFSVSDFARAVNKLYVRAGDTVYLYGGDKGTTALNAGEMPADVQTPYFSAQPPAKAGLIGLDMTCTNVWRVEVLVDPDNEAASILAGTGVTGCSFPRREIGLTGETSHIALKFSCSAAGDGTISNAAVHHSGKQPGA